MLYDNVLRAECILGGKLFRYSLRWAEDIPIKLLSLPIN